MDSTTTFGFEIVETPERVAGIEPALVTVFRWRADRRARRLNKQRRVPFYRWEVESVVYGGYRLWGVVAMQNRAVKPE